MMVAGGVIVLVLIVGADDDDVVAADDETLAVATHAGAGGGSDTFDEAVRGSLKAAPMSLSRSDIARTDGHERADADRCVGPEVKALRH
jgi:hypothetical protein